ncbi:hypothetical protein QVD17_30251 [Tagetes erecta]|uniref:Secreted protein n=1 Tax=Tagetes erecta TaxID=13708 RepID=A0AAD8K7L4_TARER|nr:hypothetical protein QVD17_30251 [Tagetes erecta]
MCLTILRTVLFSFLFQSTQPQLEDLQEIVSNPSSIHILGMIAAKRKGSGAAAAGASSCSGFGFTIVAAAHANCDGSEASVYRFS